MLDNVGTVSLLHIIWKVRCDNNTMPRNILITKAFTSSPCNFKVLHVNDLSFFFFVFFFVTKMAYAHIHMWWYYCCYDIAVMVLLPAKHAFNALTFVINMWCSGLLEINTINKHTCWNITFLVIVITKCSYFITYTTVVIKGKNWELFLL